MGSITLDLSEEKELKFSDVFSGISYLPLKSEEAGVFDRINKIVVTRSSIYLFDYFGTESLYIFDHDGILRNTLSKKGNGPGEYNVVRDFGVNEDKGLIEILDARNSLHQYDLEGNFIESINLPYNSMKFEYLSQDNYLFYSPAYLATSENEVCFFWEFDIQTNEVNCSPSIIEKFPIAYMEANVFAKYQDRIFFSRTMDNAIYHYDHDSSKMDVRYMANFGNRGFTESEVYSPEYQRTLISLINNGEKTALTPGLFASERWLINAYYEDGYLFVNYETQKLIYGQAFVNDVDGGLPTLAIKGLYDNQLISLISAPELLEADSIQSLTLLELAKGMDENSPPILQFMKLKD